MKQKVLFLFLISSFLGFSQNNSLNVYSQDGDPFFVIVNGEKRNPNAETNVTVDGLNKDVMYKVKVVFADGTTPDADKNIFFEKNNQLMTAAIDKKMKDGKVVKVKLRYAGLTDKNVGTTATTTNTNTVSGTGNGTGTYNNTGNTGNNTNVNYNSGTTNTGTASGSTNVGTTTTTTSTTTTTTTDNGTNGGSVGVNVTDPNTGENVNLGVNVNISGNGANAGTNVNSSSSSTTTTTYSSSTTTTTSGNVDNSSYQNTNTNNSGYDQNVPTYVPGYTGNIGCNNVLISEDEVVGALENESFSDDKMMILKQATKNKCVSTDQVLTLLEQFDFSDDKLEAAKFLYDRTYDKDNYYKVTNSFTFSSTKEELNEYIEGR